MGSNQYDTPYRRVARLMRQHIKAGLYNEHEKLPSVEKLAANYRVTIGVIRNALAMLRLDGVLVARSGVGHFIATDENQEMDDARYALKTAQDAVAKHGADAHQIAELTGVSHWHIHRMLSGGRIMTLSWSQKIVEAAKEIERRSREIPAQE